MTTSQINDHSESLCITHGDVDGMLCAAQIIRQEGESCELMFSNARWIASKLRSIHHRAPFPKKLFITDIPANDEAMAVIESLASAGVIITWVDHHPWFPVDLVDRAKEKCDTVIYHESMRTPAAFLLGQHLSSKDPYFDRIGRICYAYDQGIEWERNWFRLLSSLVAKSNRSVLSRLAFDQEFTEEDQRRIELQIKLEEKAKIILSQPPCTELTNTGRIVAIYDLSHEQDLYLGHRIFEHHDVDYSLIRIGEQKWQVAANPDRSLNLENLVGEYNLEGLRIRVAGRPRELLAIELISGEITLSAHEQIVTWIKSKL